MAWKKLIAGIGLLSCLADSPVGFAGPVTPEKPLSQLVLNNERFDLEKAKIIRYADYGSENIIAFIMGDHYPREGEENFECNAKNSEKTQNEIYSTLEELAAENHSRFTGLEGYEGEFSKDSLAGLPEGVNAMYGLIMGADSQDKRFLVNHFCFKYGFCPAGYAFELVHGQKIFTFGVENEELFDKALKIKEEYEKARSLMQKLNYLAEKEGEWEKLSESERTRLVDEIIKPFIKVAEEFNKVVVKERSRVFVDSLLKMYNNWKQQGNESKVIALISGGAHHQTLAEYLDELNQSYVILKPDSYDNNCEQYSK